jgi:integrase
VILTAARSGEALRAIWDEIEFQSRTWTIPADRMKAGKGHRVPLAEAVLGILEPLHANRADDFIFAGGKAHDWAAERTNFPREVAEMALAHAIPSAVEMSEKRRRLMDSWAEYCANVGGAAAVVPLRRRETSFDQPVSGKSQK